MANNTTTKEKGSNATPIIVIGLIFLATIAGIWAVSSSGKDETKTNSNANSSKDEISKQAAANFASAPAGATPESFKGSASATVTIEEFADFQCAACSAKHPVFNDVVAAYGSKIKFVFRNFPIFQQHAKAYEAAVAVEAAGFQGKFWEMQNLLFKNQRSWVIDADHRKTFEGYAKSLQMDVEKFSNDSLGISAKNRVDEDMKRGNAVGVRSTPSVFINGKLVQFENMTLEGMKVLIDAELKRMASDAENQTTQSDKSKGEDEKNAGDNAKEPDAK